MAERPSMKRVDSGLEIPAHEPAAVAESRAETVEVFQAAASSKRKVPEFPGQLIAVKSDSFRHDFHFLYL